MTSGTGRRRNRELEDLSRYLVAIRKYPPLAPNEEHDLAVRASRGDAHAKQKLVRHNLGFVVAMARQYSHAGLRLEDLVQEGNLGLIRAVEKFDPFAATRFLTYATWWIRAYLGKHLSEGRSVVRPRSGSVARSDTSLDAPISDDADASRLELVADDGPGPERAYALAEKGRRTRDALAKARRRIGLLGWDIVQERLQQDAPKTLAEIGRRWGVSRERVRQVEVQTRAFLHRYLEELDDDGRDAA